MATFAQIVEADKLISHFPGWSDPEPETGYVWFDAPLEIGGVTEAGLFFHGGALIEHPDRNVIFELAVRPLQGRRRVPLCRLDWRSLKGGHTNPRRGLSKWAGKRVSATHHHAFDLNWIETEGRMRGKNLPIAMEVEDVLDTFEMARAFAGKSFKINNIDLVPPPKWEYDLFHGSGT